MGEHQTWILHIDMDAFFASVEQLDNPELRGKPVAVGGTGERSVISAASYEIRKYGVRSAMPGKTAKRLCPHGIFLPGRMHRYKEVSRQVMQVLSGFSPVVEQASVDEAYVDGTGLEGLYGPMEELCMAIKTRMREETGLTCSVGAAPVRFVAKIASDWNKPDGMKIIHPHEMRAFLDALPVERIPGVGKTAQQSLAGVGVRTVADVLRYPEAFWDQRFGKWGRVLFARANGVDPTGVVTDTERKSCSAENTLSADSWDKEHLRRWLLLQADRVGSDLRRLGVSGRTVTLKVKFSDFRQITRSRSLDVPVQDTRTIYGTACQLLEELELPRSVRLIGVGVSNFGGKARQMSLFDEPQSRPDATVDRAVDAVRKKFGKNALKRGELLGLKD